MTAVLAVVVGLLFAFGSYLLMQRPLTRVVIGVGLLGHGANLLLLLAGGRAGDPPLVTDAASPPSIASPTGGAGVADPLPQALALTAIVIFVRDHRAPCSPSPTAVSCCTATISSTTPSRTTWRGVGHAGTRSATRGRMRSRVARGRTAGGRTAARWPPKRWPGARRRGFERASPAVRDRCPPAGGAPAGPP